MRAILYTEPGCRFCQMARDFLSSHGIGYTERDVSIDQSAREELAELGALAVPVIIIENHVILGFNIQKLSEIIGE